MDQTPPLPSEIAKAKPVTRAGMDNVQPVRRLVKGVIVLQVGLILAVVFYSIAVGLYLNLSTATRFGKGIVLWATYIPAFQGGWMLLLGLGVFACCFVGALLMALGASGRRGVWLALMSALCMGSVVLTVFIGALADTHVFGGSKTRWTAALLSLTMFISPFLMIRFIRRMAHSFVLPGLDGPCRLWGYVLPVLILLQFITIVLTCEDNFDAPHMWWLGTLTCTLSVFMMLALVVILHRFNGHLRRLTAVELRVR